MGTAAWKHPYGNAILQGAGVVLGLVLACLAVTA